MRKDAGVNVGGTIFPVKGWSKKVVSSYHGADGYTFFELGAVPKQTVVPNSVGACSAETIDLYREFYTRSDGLAIIGCSKSVTNNNSIVENIETICGRKPKFLAHEFEELATGNQGKVVEVLRNHAASGGYIGLHDHPNNPVTGGIYSDRTGSPLAGIKSGGAQRAAFLSYLDEIASVISQLAPYPVIYRPFHEMNGNWFWWGGVDRVADLITIWQDTVNYLRVTKGLTNVLFSWNINGANYDGDVTNNLVTTYATWWPGDTYVDLISMDQYDNAVSPILLRNSIAVASWQALMVLARKYNKPLYIAEIGSQYGSKDIAGFWESGLFSVLDAYPSCSAIATWNGTWAPAPNTPAADSFRTGVARCGRLLG